MSHESNTKDVEKIQSGTGQVGAAQSETVRDDVIQSENAPTGKVVHPDADELVAPVAQEQVLRFGGPRIQPVNKRRLRRENKLKRREELRRQLSEQLKDQLRNQLTEKPDAQRNPNLQPMPFAIDTAPARKQTKRPRMGIKLDRVHPGDFRRYAMTYACEHCSHFDATKVKCSMGYQAQHTLDKQNALYNRTGHMAFCRFLEID